MINYNGHNITKLSYNNHMIKKAYGCDGRLVWDYSDNDFFLKLTLDTGEVVEIDGNGTLESVHIPMVYEAKTVYGATGSRCTAIGDSGVFRTFYNMSAFTISNTVEKIGSWAFSISLNSLKSIIIPDSVTEIGEFAFYNSTANGKGIGEVSIGRGVEKIGEYAFCGCAFSSITIPDNVEILDKGAFVYCSGLTSITCEATTPPTLGSYVFDNTNNAPIYVPCDSLEAYKSAENWSNYADRIQCIEPATPKWIATYQDSHTESGACDEYCLNSYEIPNKSDVVSIDIQDCVTCIGEGGLFNLINLAVIDLPSGVTYFCCNSFKDCSSLQYMVFRSPTVMAFQGDVDVCGNYTYAFLNTNDCDIYVPDDLVSSYKSRYSELASRFKPLSEKP